jgi:hypothetical protein
MEPITLGIIVTNPPLYLVVKMVPIAPVHDLRHELKEQTNTPPEVIESLAGRQYSIRAPRTPLLKPGLGENINVEFWRQEALKGLDAWNYSIEDVMTYQTLDTSRPNVGVNLILVEKQGEIALHSP